MRIATPLYIRANSYTSVLDRNFYSVTRLALTLEAACYRVPAKWILCSRSQDLFALSGTR